MDSSCLLLESLHYLSTKLGQLHALRVRMVREGYALEGLTSRDRERVWYSLASKRRWPQVAALLEIEGAALDDLVARVRRERAQLGRYR
jgi:hypothetical protein